MPIWQCKLNGAGRLPLLIIIAFVLVLFAPVRGFSQITSMSFDRVAIVPGECWTVTVVTAPNMTIDVQFHYNLEPSEPVPAWQTLDAQARNWFALRPTPLRVSTP